MNTASGEFEPLPELQFILKVASRCNLNCNYCYVYNKGDDGWKQRPPIMPNDIFEAALRRIGDHCKKSGQEAVRITFHGGEPCLVNPNLFERWCKYAHDTIGGTCRLDLSIQTNGTLIDRRWIEMFQKYSVSVGISLDGPKDVNDAGRVDHAGQGSYEKAARGLALLGDNDVPFQVLTVVQPGADSLRIHRHLLSLGVKRINYLLPDFTHDTVAPVRALYGPTPCADYLIPILEDWWANGSIDVKIGLFWNMARVILGGSTQIDLFGSGCYHYVFVESDGSIEGLDVLRICGANLASTGLHILHDDFSEIADRSPLHRSVMFDGVPLPEGCRSCHERSTCAGGYLPHRFSVARGLDNPSIWCLDMLRLLGRMRELLDVTVQETDRRRAIVTGIAAVGV